MNKRIMVQQIHFGELLAGSVLPEKHHYSLKKNMKHLINWIQIPALDIERTKNFYSNITGGIRFTDYPMPEKRFTTSLKNQKQ